MGTPDSRALASSIHRSYSRSELRRRKANRTRSAGRRSCGRCGRIRAMSAAATEARLARHNVRAGESARVRPRVLHLITSFEIGGTERQAVELLKHLDRERYDVRLAVLRNEGPFYAEIEELFPDVPEFPLTSFY